MSNEIVSPNDAEAERVTLGSLMTSPEGLPGVMGFLRPEMFYEMRHNWIYGAILALYAKREAIDLVTVANELRRGKCLEEVGAESYLAKLTDDIPYTGNVVSYARIVEEMWTRRQMIRAASQVAKLAYDLSVSKTEMVGKCQAATNSVAMGQNKTGSEGMNIAVNEFLQAFENVQNGGSFTEAKKTGVSALDVTGGVVKERLTILGAYPGAGKTSLAVQVALSVAKQGWRVLYLPFEMSKLDMVMRCLSHLSKVPYSGMLMARLPDDAVTKVYRNSGPLADLPIELAHMGSADALQIKSIALQAAQKFGAHVDLIVVDQLQHMRDYENGKDDTQKISHIARHLREMCHDSDLGKPAVWALSKFNREGYGTGDTRPGLKSFKQSGDIESEADQCIALHPGPGNVVEVMHLKNRHGQANDVMARFYKDVNTFE